jgi:hypothetical protein
VANNVLSADRGCPVSPCVIARGQKNCAQCAEDGCQQLIRGTGILEEVAPRKRGSIPDANRARFIGRCGDKARFDRIQKPAA